MDSNPANKADAQFRAGVYARLSEARDAAESVPTQVENGTRHAARRGDQLVATFKDDGYSAYKEITRDGFLQLIDAIERGELDVVIVRDVDRLTRNLEDWNRFERACIQHGVILSSYTGGDLDLRTPEGAYYGGMETLRARRESAVKSARVREAIDRNARQGKKTGGGSRWFGYRNVYADPNEMDPRFRRVIRVELDPVESELVREAVRRVLDFGEPVGSILRDWEQRKIKPVKAEVWRTSALRQVLTSARIAGYREWQGEKYQATWPAIIDLDTHERLRKLFLDPARKIDATRRQTYLLAGLLICPQCGHRLYNKPHRDPKISRAYGCVAGPGRGCGRLHIKAEILEEYITGAVLDALESPRVQEALQTQDAHTERRAEILELIKRAEERRNEARRDYAEDAISRADWLDIRGRIESRIASLRHEYDRLSGGETVLGDIPPEQSVRDAWESWNIDRRRAAIRSVLHPILIKPHPAGKPSNPAGRSKDPVLRRERELARVIERVVFDWRH
jgi:site-specific DNA recombinase